MSKGGAYRKHLGLTAPLLVLNVANSEKRMAQMIKTTTSLFPNGNSYMLFQHWSDFGPVFKPPTATLDMFIHKCGRAGLDKFDLSNTGH